MYKLDSQEKLIVRELIRDPRISDNQIAIKTNVPLKTVNRKRKLLEENNMIHYFCCLDTSQTGTGTYLGRSLFIIIFREGITRKAVLERQNISEKAMRFFPKHIFFTLVGEYEGNVAMIILIESLKVDDLVEIFNAEVVPELEASLGTGCVKKTMTIPVASTVRQMRNYLPNRNIASGKIKESWPNESIFVDE